MASQFCNIHPPAALLLLPSLFFCLFKFLNLQELQKMDERRIQKTGELLEEYSNVETKVMPIIQKCLDNIKDNGKSVNPPQVLWKGHNFQLPFASVSKQDHMQNFWFNVRLICVENECEGEKRFRLNGSSQTHFDTKR